VYTTTRRLVETPPNSSHPPSAFKNNNTILYKYIILCIYSVYRSPRKSIASRWRWSYRGSFLFIEILSSAVEYHNILSSANDEARMPTFLLIEYFSFVPLTGVAQFYEVGLQFVYKYLIVLNPWSRRCSATCRTYASGVDRSLYAFCGFPAKP